MSSLSEQAIRHALKTAQERNFSFVKVKVGDVVFKANFSPNIEEDFEEEGFVEAGSSAMSNPSEISVVAPMVGYYHTVEPKLVVGSKINKGDLLAKISALGLFHEVHSPCDGELTQIIEQDNQPVQFHQVIAVIQEGRSS
jgi:biotin carboxyl carrier protein